MWELYDALISKIPDDIEVTKFLSGSSMTYVCAGDAAGVCETIGGGLYSGWGAKNRAGSYRCPPCSFYIFALVGQVVGQKI